MKKEDLYNLIQKQGILPLFYHPDLEVSKKLLQMLYENGIRAVEYTNRGAKAEANFKALVHWSHENLEEFKLGIGTLKNKAAAASFASIGADFLVSPGYDEGVFEVSKETGLLWIPGCMTPTEVMKAESKGLSLVKIFPGNVLTPAMVKAIKSICPDVAIMATGGVTPQKENLEAWFTSGVDIVGMGSQLIRKDLLAKEDYKTLGELVKKTIQMIQDIRKN